MRKRVLAIAAAVTMAVAGAAPPAGAQTTPDAPAAADPAQQIQVPPAHAADRATKQQRDTCPAVRASLGKLAAAGQQSVTCETVRETPSAAAKAAMKSARFAAAMQEVPQWCVDNAFTGWWFVRTGGCMIQDRLLTVTNTSTGAVTGTMPYLMLTYSYTSIDLGAWAHQIELYPYDITGSAAGTTVNGSARCTGACFMTDTVFPPQLMRLRIDSEAEFFADSTVGAPGTVGFGRTSISYFWTNPQWASGAPVNISPPWDVRCDNNTSGKDSAGCVFPDYPPAVVVSRTGPYPSFARHLADAQASGLPGAYPNGVPLTRMVNAADSDRNGNTACPQASSGGYPRPAGHSCDEYPFRSTYQGAYTATRPAPPAPGRTFDWCQITALGSGAGAIGWSACMIPVGENSGGGALLNGFGGIYRTQRMLDGDDFYVWIVP